MPTLCVKYNTEPQLYIIYSGREINKTTFPKTAFPKILSHKTCGSQSNFNNVFGLSVEKFLNTNWISRDKNNIYQRYGSSGSGMGGGMDWIDLARDTDRWRAVVKAVLNLRVT